jgi:hypothetical protein
MKYNKPKQQKTDKGTRFKPPEGLNPYKEVYRARLDSPYKEEILWSRVIEKN